MYCHWYLRLTTATAVSDEEVLWRQQLYYESHHLSRFHGRPNTRVAVLVYSSERYRKNKKGELFETVVCVFIMFIEFVIL